MIRHNLKILQHLQQYFLSVSHHFGTLCIKGLKDIAQPKLLKYDWLEAMPLTWGLFLSTIVMHLQKIKTIQRNPSISLTENCD